MATKAHHKRTTRMSFVLNDVRSASYFTSCINKHNGRQYELSESKKRTGSRFAPMYIARLAFLVQGSETLVLVRTSGNNQFEFTRWYGFLRDAFGFAETMNAEDKSEQLRNFGRLLHVVKELEFQLDESALKAGAALAALDDANDGAGTEPPQKMIALSNADGSYQPVRTRVAKDGGDSSVMMQQTKLIVKPVVEVTSSPQVVNAQSPKRVRSNKPTPVKGVGQAVVSPAKVLLPTKLIVDVPNIFSLAEPESDWVAMVVSFLAGKTPIYKLAKRVDAMRPGESAVDYYTRVRKAVNTSPCVMKLIHKVLPPAITSAVTQQDSVTLFKDLEPEHAEHLSELARMFHTSWRGVFTLYLTVDSQELNYGVFLPVSSVGSEGLTGTEVSKKSSFLELWRRALEFEDALRKLAKFLVDIIGSHSPHAISSRVSQRTIGNACALLSAGAGLYSDSDGNFWKPRELEIIKKLAPASGEADIVDTIRWLSTHREAAFSALFPAVDELSLLMPVLARVFGFRRLLGGLDSHVNVRVVLADLKKYVKAKINLYSASSAWLLLYGGRLTVLVREAIKWCMEFQAVTDSPRADAAGDGHGVRVLTLSEDGYVIGMDGHPLKKGHVDDGWTGGIIPFPESCLAVEPLPMDELKRMKAAFAAHEAEALNAMLSELKDPLAKMGCESAKPPAIRLMEYGISNVAGYFAEDSHKKKATCYLPPTASMPDAVYSPDVIYRGKR